MMRSAVFTLCAAGLVVLAGAVHASEQDSFSVNAQYRGVVKKAFVDIGNGTLARRELPSGAFRVSGKADVVHPREKGRVYKFHIDMTFTCSGDHVDYLRNRNWCNRGSESALREIEKILPFVYLTREPDAFKGGSHRTMTTSQGEFDLRSVTTERNLEVTLSQGGATVGKFFLARTLEEGQYPLEKFRIPKEDVTLSFVVRP